MPAKSKEMTAATTADLKAAADLLPQVYQELREIAARALAQESAGHTLQPTALVHEAYLKLAGPTPEPKWACKTHFLHAAAQAMRRILVDHARRRRRLKRGGDRVRSNLVNELETDKREDDLLAVDALLDQLTEFDPAMAALVQLHIYAGLTIEQAADELHLSARTAYRNWAFARTWMFRRLQAATGVGSDVS